MEPLGESIQRLKAIPGVDRIVAWTILSELGPDVERVCRCAARGQLGGNVSGQQRERRQADEWRTRHANSYLRRMLTQAAWAASRTKNTYLSALYRRLRARLGHNKAIFAVTHQILVVAYTMLKRGEDYRELGGDYCDRRNQPRVAKRLVERLG